MPDTRAVPIVVAALAAVSLAAAPAGAQEHPCRKIRVAPFLAETADLKPFADSLSTAIPGAQAPPSICWLTPADGDSAQAVLMGGVVRGGGDSVSVRWSVAELSTMEIIAMGEIAGSLSDLPKLAMQVAQAAGAQR